MRYNDYRFLTEDEEWEGDSKDHPVSPVQKQQPQQSVQQKVDPRISHFIRSCIPDDLEPEEKQQAYQYLSDRITDVRQIHQIDGDKVLLMLRDYYANNKPSDKISGDLNKRITQSNYYDRGMNDQTALTNLIDISERLNTEIIMTVMSDLGDDTMNMNQRKFDYVANYSGRRANAEKIEEYLGSKYGTQRGVYLNFRSIKDPMGCVACVLLDTDRKKIYVGGTFRHLKLVTERDGEISKERVKAIVVGNTNDRERNVLYHTVTPKIKQFQQMMNSGEILELYDTLSVDYEDDIQDKLTGQNKNEDFRTTRK